MGENAVNKTRVLTFCGLQLWKKRVHTKWGLCFFSQHLPPCLGLFFFPSLNVWTTPGQTSSFLLEPHFFLLMMFRTITGYYSSDDSNTILLIFLKIGQSLVWCMLYFVKQKFPPFLSMSIYKAIASVQVFPTLTKNYLKKKINHIIKVFNLIYVP